MIKTDNLIIGAGLFGSVIAAALRAKGQQTLVVADQRAGMGSRPAACLMRPSWLSSFPVEERRASLGLLDELYGLQDIRFSLPVGHATVHWVDPAKVLQPPDVHATLQGFVSVAGGWEAQFSEGRDRPGLLRIQARRLVLALGIWQNAIQPKDWPQLRALHGMAVLIPKATLAEPFIRPWAPYRQLVGFNRGDGLWVGDGTAIRGHKWTLGHQVIIRDRCLSAVNMRSPVAEHDCLHGIRPYSEEKPCFLRNPHSGLWFASGGAKNGTVAAGWCAHVISEAKS